MRTLSIVWGALLCVVMGACERKPPAPAGSLIEAIVARDVEAVRAHVEAGTDVNAADDPTGATPLIAAATSGQPEVVRLLLAKGAAINARGLQKRTALIYAIQAQQVETAILLIDQEGIDLEAREAHGSTALVEAVAFGEMSVAEKLIERGADVNAPGPLGRTALHIAAGALNNETIEWLIEHGANGDVRDDEGATALHSGAMCPAALDDFETSDPERGLELLVKSSSEVNAPNNQGQTPLHVAVLWASPWVVDRLLAAGGDPLAQDQQGYSPVAYLSAEGVGAERSLDEAMAVIAEFREAGVSSETPIDARGTKLSVLEDWLRERG